AEITLDLVGAFDEVTESDELVVAQILDADVTGDPGLLESGEGARAAHLVDVGERHFHALVARDVDAGETCHACTPESCRRSSRHRCPGLRARGVTPCGVLGDACVWSCELLLIPGAACDGDCSCR